MSVHLRFISFNCKRLDLSKKVKLIIENSFSSSALVEKKMHCFSIWYSLCPPYSAFFHISNNNPKNTSKSCLQNDLFSHSNHYNNTWKSPPWIILTHHLHAQKHMWPPMLVLPTHRHPKASTAAYRPKLCFIYDFVFYHANATRTAVVETVILHEAVLQWSQNQLFRLSELQTAVRLISIGCHVATVRLIWNC